MTIELRHRDALLWPRYGLAFVAGLFVLGCFQSGNMVALAYDLPEGNFAQWVVARAENWHGWMQLIGFADLGERLAEISSKLHAITIVKEDL